jgi:hypothetical protein
MSFTTGTQVETLYSLNGAVTKNTYTTQAVISALAASQSVAKIQGGFLADNPNPVGRAFYLKACGSIATTSAATFIPALGFDTTAGTPANQVAFCTAVTPTAAITTQWDLEAWITCFASGETGGTTFQVNGTWRETTVASGGAANSAAVVAMFAQSVTGLLSSTTYYVELLGTWSASAAGNTTTLQQMLFLGLN